MAKDPKDKYGREVRVETLYGKQYKILPEVRKPTRAIRGLGGRFLGRYSGAERSDGTQYVRILQPVDINHDGMPDLSPGQIVGRVSRYPNMRPRQDQPIQVKVHVSNKASISAMRKIQQEKFMKIRSSMKSSKSKSKKTKRRLKK